MSANIAGSYKINGTEILNPTTLGSSVVNSSLTNLGSLTSLTVNGPINLNNPNAPGTGQLGQIKYAYLETDPGALTPNVITNLAQITLSAGTWIVKGVLCGYNEQTSGVVQVGIQGANNTIGVNYSTNSVVSSIHADAGGYMPLNIEVTIFTRLTQSTTLYLNVKANPTVVYPYTYATNIQAIRIA
jgi:hypothetical protein